VLVHHGSTAAGDVADAVVVLERVAQVDVVAAGERG